MSRIIIITLICFFCVPCLSLEAQETAMISDHGSYSLDFGDLDNIRWQFERRYKIVPGNEADAEILKNIIIETSNQENDELIDARVWIHTQRDDSIFFPRDSFKMQPFDATWTEYILTADDLDVRDTLEISYTIHSDVTAKMHLWRLQYAFPVKESEISFLFPKTFSYADHITDRSYIVQEMALDSVFDVGRNGLVRGKIPLHGKKVSFADIPPYVQEPFSPELIEIRPTHILNLTEAFVGDEGAYLPSWAEQCADLSANEYFGRQYRSKSEYRWMLEEAEDIVKTNYADELFILKLYEFIHSQFQWDGSYGLFPSHSIREMQIQKTVNKAALNMAMLALLVEVGFDAYPVLVNTTDQHPVYVDIPNVNQFNHFIIEVQLRDKNVYVDCGQVRLAPGWIDYGIRKDLAVRLKNFKGDWLSLPDFESSSTLLINMNVARDFSASGSITASFMGYDAFNERNSLAADPSAQYWKTRAEALSRDIRIDSVKFNNVKNLNEPFENTVYFHIEPSLDQEELSVHPVPYSFFNQRYLEDSIRTNPVVLPLKMHERTILNLNLDSALSVASLPPSRRMRLEGNQSFMEYVTSYNTDKLESRFEIKFDEVKFSALEYDALKLYLEEVYDLLNHQIVVLKD